MVQKHIHGQNWPYTRLIFVHADVFYLTKDQNAQKRLKQNTFCLEHFYVRLFSFRNASSDLCFRFV